jgi:hypothetical protein
MKTLRPFLVFACLLASSTSTILATSFEGTIAMSMTTGKRTTPVTYFIKGEGLRFESAPVDGPKTTGLLNATTGAISILMDEQKMYMTVGAPKKGKVVESTITATGRTETIAGYSCTEYVVKEKKSVIEVWLTTELGAFPNLAEAFANRGRRSAWETLAAEQGGFALRVITKNNKGKVLLTLECTAVEPKSLDAALFVIPADYTQLKMPGLGELLGR